MKYKISLLSSILAVFLPATSQADSMLQALTPSATATASATDYCSGRYCTGNVTYFKYSANDTHSFYINSTDKDKLDCEPSADGWVYITDYANKKDIQSAVLSAHVAKSKILLKFRDDSSTCQLEWLMMFPRNL